MPGASAKRGEVWQADLGLVAKVRPVLVLGVPGPKDRAIFTFVPHTTSPAGTDYEVSVPVRFLQMGVFDAQAISTVQTIKLLRKLGILNPEQIRKVEDAVLDWLQIDCSTS